MEQLILHLIGDYVTQSHWMATEKIRHAWPAAAHATLYSLPFLLLGPSWLAFAVILGTHFLIDRFRLARYVCWAKNWLGPPLTFDWTTHRMVTTHHPWAECRATGYHESAPLWLTAWLCIACDNTMHLAINYAALRWL